MISKEFIKNLPDNLTSGSRAIINKYNEAIKTDIGRSIKLYNEYLDYYAFFEAFLKSKNYDFIPLILSASKSKNIDLIKDFFINTNSEFTLKENEKQIEDARQGYGILFGNQFSYEFTDGDLTRIQELINELREEVTSSTFFSEEHQQRLLKKLEKMQAELHKKMSSLDSFWGLLGDAGVAIGKFGNDAKPFVDRIREIAEIGWRTQSNAEELPSGTKIPFLSNDNGITK